MPTTTFVFNGNKYDTERFIKAQIVFTKVLLKEPPSIYAVGTKPFINEAFTTPVVTTVEGQMVVMACTQSYKDKDHVKETQYLLVTKHKLKSLIAGSYQETSVHTPYLAPDNRSHAPRPWSRPEYDFSVPVDPNRNRSSKRDWT